MNASSRRSPADVRGDILVAAWGLFRQLGVRATIADVAAQLGMSSANIYRFFASKQALTDAVCANQLAALIGAARAAAKRPGAAGERIRATILALRAGMIEQMLHEARLQEVVDLALNEHWPAIDVFYTQCVDIVAALVAEGQAQSEFGPGEPRALAQRTLAACVATYHPALIARAANLSLPVSPEEVVDFALRALAIRTAELPSPPPGGDAA